MLFGKFCLYKCIVYFTSIFSLIELNINYQGPITTSLILALIKDIYLFLYGVNYKALSHTLGMIVTSQV